MDRSYLIKTGRHISSHFKSTVYNSVGLSWYQREEELTNQLEKENEPLTPYKNSKYRLIILVMNISTNFIWAKHSIIFKIDFILC
jgi:hypothetical protein